MEKLPEKELGLEKEVTGITKRIGEILRDLESINDRGVEFTCPACLRTLQKCGKRIKPNSIVLQRFVCPDCRSLGRKHNYFLDIDVMNCIRRSP